MLGADFALLQQIVADGFQSARIVIAGTASIFAHPGCVAELVCSPRTPTWGPPTYPSLSRKGGGDLFFPSAHYYGSFPDVPDFQDLLEIQQSNNTELDDYARTNIHCWQGTQRQKKNSFFQHFVDKNSYLQQL